MSTACDFNFNFKLKALKSRNHLLPFASTVFVSTTGLKSKKSSFQILIFWPLEGCCAQKIKQSFIHVRSCVCRTLLFLQLDVASNLRSIPNLNGFCLAYAAKLLVCLIVAFLISSCELSNI